MKTPKDEKKIDFDAVEYIEPEDPKDNGNYEFGLNQPTLDKGLATRTPRGKIRQVTVGSSVWSYQNKGGDCDMVVSGGTGVSIEFSRDNITKIAVTSPIRLSQGDRVHITHSGTPNAYIIPR